MLDENCFYVVECFKKLRFIKSVSGAKKLKSVNYNGFFSRTSAKYNYFHFLLHVVFLMHPMLEDERYNTFWQPEIRF